jgi:cyclopropane fatty-acyl-phospholipid synthase-like methyltransferase
MGPNALWLVEELSCYLELKPGMRILDMGCGRAMTSIFLAKEFGVHVYATDLWIDAADNWQRICEAGMQDLVVPIHAEARALPFADNFFDAAISIDSYHYYGTDDLYLKYFGRFIRAEGQIGVVMPGLTNEFEGPVPDHLTRPGKHGNAFWDPAECFSLHSPDWWHNHWRKTGLVELEHVGLLPDGAALWIAWNDALESAGSHPWPDEIDALKADKGDYLGFTVMTARSRD